MASKVAPEILQQMRDLLAALPAIHTMASAELLSVLEHERRLAKEQDRSGPALEHLLRAIMLEPSGEVILRKSGAQLETLDLALARSGSRTNIAHTSVRDQTVQSAQLRASLRSREMTIADLVCCIIYRPESSAMRLLAKHGSNAVDILRYLAHGTVKVDRPASMASARVIRGVERNARGTGPYRLIIINDEFTSLQFVTNLLTSMFGKTEQEANNLATAANDHGRAAIGEFELKTALRHMERALRRAEEAGFPVQFAVEPSDETDQR